MSVNYANSAGSAPASDVYSWAKASTKPSYSYSEISGTPGSLPASDVYSWAKASSKPSYAYSEIEYTPNIESSSKSGSISVDGSVPVHRIVLNGDVSNITLSTDPQEGHSTHIILAAGSADRSVSISHHSSNRVCPGGSSNPISFTIPSGGYGEVDFLRLNSKNYVRAV